MLSDMYSDLIVRNDVDLRIPVVKKMCKNVGENVTSQKMTSEDYLRLNIDIDNKTSEELCLVKTKTLIVSSKFQSPFLPKS